MLILCSLQFLFLLLALALISLPFLKFYRSNSSSNKKVFFDFYLISFLTATTAIIFYLLGSQPLELQKWLKTGKAHHELLTQYHELGGIDGMISKVKQKIETNPTDAQGWFILGKLYLMKDDKAKADVAFAKSRDLT